MLIGYARVSTQDQDPQLQIDALKAAGCERIFTERASGAQRDRPELAKALDYLREGDALAVWKLDRLARSTLQLIETLQDMKARGIGFRCLTQPIDTTTSAGVLMFQMLGAFAEFERSLIRERTAAGLARAKAQGRRGGRKPKLTEADKAVGRVLLADGALSVPAIAKRLNVSTATFYRAFPAARASAVSANIAT